LTTELLIYQWILLLLFGLGFFLVIPASKTVEEFFRAYTKTGKQTGLWMLVSSLVISWIFAKSITITANLSRDFGFVGGLSYAAYYLSFIVAGLVIYNLRTKGGYKSLHHFLETKFGKSALILFSILIGFRLFNEVWSNSMVIGSYFGPEYSAGYYAAILVFTALTLAYSLKGGLRTSLITDAVQMIMFGVLLITVLSFIFPNSSKTPLEFFSTGEWKMSMGLNLMFTAFIQIFSYPFHDPVLTDRAFISPSRITRRALFIASLIGILCISAFSLVGVYAHEIGAVSDAAKNVAVKLGLVSMLLMNFIMVTSAASTLDSAFSSFSKLAVVDIFPKAKPTLRKGRITMIILAVAGTLPIFFKPEILSATTVSGTMVIGLAPVFIFWKDKSSTWSFHLCIGFGILVGVILALGIFPEMLTFTSGRYASLLWANVWGSIGCVLIYKLSNKLFN